MQGRPSGGRLKFQVKGSGFRVQRFRVQGKRFRVQCLGPRFRVQGLGSKV